MKTQCESKAVRTIKAMYSHSYKIGAWNKHNAQFVRISWNSRLATNQSIFWVKVFLQRWTERYSLLHWLQSDVSSGLWTRHPRGHGPHDEYRPCTTIIIMTFSFQYRDSANSPHYSKQSIQELNLSINVLEASTALTIPQFWSPDSLDYRSELILPAVLLLSCPFKKQLKGPT